MDMEALVLKSYLQKRQHTILILPYYCITANSDPFVRAYGETYGLPYVLTIVPIITDHFIFKKN
jgi:hypothetical protein